MATLPLGWASLVLESILLRVTVSSIVSKVNCINVGGGGGGGGTLSKVGALLRDYGTLLLT